jgi:hypothetical protein
LSSLLDALVAELDDEPTVGIALGGSYARGEANAYSDVDILRFVTTLPPENERYRLKHQNGLLISISTQTIADERGRLGRPEKAIWTVAGLRQWCILLDKDGSLAQLQQEALAFTWEPLQAAADEHASHLIAGNAEEAHKVLGGLTRRDESATLYGALGLYLGMAQALAVQRGVLIRTENSYYRQVQDAAGPNSAWTRYFRLAAAFDLGPASLTPAEVRGIAALHLYRETARLLRHILLPEHVAVVDATLAAIEGSGFPLPAAR